MNSIAKKELPSKRFEKEFFEAMVSGDSFLSDMVKLGARFMLQRGIELEIAEFLGRGYYERNGLGGLNGYRNGYEKSRLNFTEGVIDLSIPQLRNTSNRFRSKLLKAFKKRTECLERLIPQLYLKGMSTRDIEDVLKGQLGLKKVSKSVVSKLSKHLEEDFKKWRERDLSGIDILYLFLDGIYLPVRQGSDEKEAILVAYGINCVGDKILLHIALGNKESYDAWKDFIQDMKRRGLKDPMLGIGDGNPSLKKTFKESFPLSLFQLCQVHKMRNILAKLPRGVLEEMKKMVQDVFRAESYEEGIKRGKELIQRFKREYPSAMECLERDLEEVLTCLKFPKEHRRRICSTNLLERLIREGKRRTDAVGRFPGESSCLTLVYSVLIDASRSWHGVKMTAEIFQELTRLWEKIRPRTDVEVRKEAPVAV